MILVVTYLYALSTDSRFSICWQPEMLKPSFSSTITLDKFTQHQYSLRRWASATYENAELTLACIRTCSSFLHRCRGKNCVQSAHSSRLQAWWHVFAVYTKTNEGENNDNLKVHIITYTWNTYSLTRAFICMWIKDIPHKSDPIFYVFSLPFHLGLANNSVVVIKQPISLLSFISFWSKMWLLLTPGHFWISHNQRDGREEISTIVWIFFSCTTILMTNNDVNNVNLDPFWFINSC